MSSSWRHPSFGIYTVVLCSSVSRFFAHPFVYISDFYYFWILLREKSEIMAKEDMNKKIVTLLKKVFTYIAKDIPKGKGHLRIPLDEDGNYRVSEQDLRFAFVEKLLRCRGFRGVFYAVDAPTIYKYKFTENKRLLDPVCVDEGGDRGRAVGIDLVLYKGRERIALIEFKDNNASEHEYAKDFIKLSQEPGDNLVRMLVEIFRTSDDGTLKQVKRKLFKNHRGNIGDNTQYYGLSLNHNLGEKVMFTFDRTKEDYPMKVINK